MYLFESLDTYNRAVRFAAMVEMTSRDFPPSTYYFVNRLNRFAESIFDQIAQAHSTWKEEDRKNYFWRARASIQECFGLIEIASRQGFISQKLRDLYRYELDELNKEIQDLIRAPMPSIKKVTMGETVLLEQNFSDN